MPAYFKRLLAGYKRLLDRIGAFERAFGIGLIFLIVASWRAWVRFACEQIMRSSNVEHA